MTGHGESLPSQWPRARTTGDEGDLTPGSRRADPGRVRRGPRRRIHGDAPTGRSTGPPDLGTGNLGGAASVSGRACDARRGDLMFWRGKQMYRRLEVLVAEAVLAEPQVATAGPGDGAW